MAELARKLGVSAQTVDFPIEDLPDVVRGFNPDIFADAHDVAYEDVGRRLQSGDEFARMNGRLNAVVLDTNSGQVVHAWGATRELKEGVRVIDEEVWNTLPVEQRNRAIDLLRRAYMGGKDFYAEVGLALQEIMSPSDWSRIGGRSVDRIEAKEMSQQNVIAGMRSLPLETLNRAHLYLSQHLVEHDRERSGNRTELNQLAYALISNEDPVIAIQMKFSPDHPKADTPDNVPIRIKVDRTGQPPPSRSSEWKVGTLDDPEIEDAAKSLLLTRFSYGLIKAWSETSNRSSVANLVQNAAAEEFGIGAAAAPAGASDLHGAGSPTTRVARAFVRAQYEATQKMLAEQYPDTTHFVLFRGGDSEQRYSDTDNTGETWRQATLRTRPLASFSTSMGEAEEFLSEAESRLFAAAVPRERILSTPFTGNGAVIESEFVVLGGPIRGRYTGDRSSDVDFDFNVDDLPMGETEFIMIDGQPVPIGKAAYAAASQEVPNG